MSGPTPLPHLTCRKCGRPNPWVYLAPVVVEGTGTCICMDCAGGARLAGSLRQPQAGDCAMIYQVRDDPDDLPIICATEAEAYRRGRRRAARIGQLVLIYQVGRRQRTLHRQRRIAPCPAFHKLRPGRLRPSRPGPEQTQPCACAALAAACAEVRPDRSTRSPPLPSFRTHPRW